MTKKDEFKSFVKKHPILLKSVKDGEKSWQDFYEIYDMYGDDEEAWKDYLTVPVASAATFDLLGFLKNLDLDSVQESIGSVQRVLGLLQDMSLNRESTSNVKPRPIYRHFED